MASGAYLFSLNHHLPQKSICEDVCEDVLYLSPDNRLHQILPDLYPWRD